MADEQSVHIVGLDGVLRSLRALPNEITSKRGGPARAALRKGANLIRNEARANVRRIVADPNIGGGDKSTGRLARSISIVLGSKRARADGERMFVMIPKSRRYPIDKRTPTGIPVAVVGKMLEYGTSKMRPHKWMGPAFHSKKGEAVTVIASELRKGIDLAVAKLALANRA